MKHVMIDLETMGLRPDAAIVSIGAVRFERCLGEDLSNDIKVLDKFHTAVSLRSCTSLGLTTDQSTVDWWQKQSAEARSSWQQDGAPTLPDALSAFNAWVLQSGPASAIAPWGNGADFDLVLLKSAFNAIGADPPWRYYNQKCYRTIKSIFQVAELPRDGVYHNALDDAVHQTTVLRQIVKTHQISLP